MLTIDTHCHASESWFEPIEVMLFQMDRHAVDRAVLVQHRTEFDNGYLLDCVRRFPGRFAVVGNVDHTRPDAAQTLARWARAGIQGVRLSVPDRSPGDNPFAIWESAAKLEIPVSCPGSTEGFASDEFRKLVSQVSGLPIIIEHGAILTEHGMAHGPGAQRIAQPGKGDREAITPTNPFNPVPPYTDYKKVLALSKYPNVYIKVTGFGEYMPRPNPARNPPFDLAKVPPFIDMAIEAFGARRVMFGTDYPPVSLREGYGNVLRLLREYLSRWSKAEQEAVFGGTAASLFNF